MREASRCFTQEEKGGKLSRKTAPRLLENIKGIFIIG